MDIVQELREMASDGRAVFRPFSHTMTDAVNEIEGLRAALTECADRLERACIECGTDPEMAAVAVAQYRTWQEAPK